MTNSSPAVERMLEDALDAMIEVTTHDGSTTPPEVSIEAIMKSAAVVDALEELECQQLVDRDKSGSGKVLHCAEK